MRYEMSLTKLPLLGKPCLFLIIYISHNTYKDLCSFIIEVFTLLHSKRIISNKLADLSDYLLSSSIKLIVNMLLVMS